MTSLQSNSVPLAIAAENFALVCKAIDEGNINEIMDSLFHKTKLALATEVDTRICYLQLLDGAIAAAKKASDNWKQRLSQLNHAQERAEKMTLDQMSFENTIEYMGTIGRLCRQNNAESLKLNFETGKLSASNVLSGVHMEKYKIPAEYITEIKTYQLNTEKLKKDLKEGKTFEWASLTRGQQLRIRE